MTALATTQFGSLSRTEIFILVACKFIYSPNGETGKVVAHLLQPIVGSDVDVWAEFVRLCDSSTTTYWDAFDLRHLSVHHELVQRILGQIRPAQGREHHEDGLGVEAAAAAAAAQQGNNRPSASTGVAASTDVSDFVRRKDDRNDKPSPIFKDTGRLITADDSPDPWSNSNVEPDDLDSIATGEATEKIVHHDKDTARPQTFVQNKAKRRRELPEEPEATSWPTHSKHHATLTHDPPKTAQNKPQVCSGISSYSVFNFVKTDQNRPVRPSIVTLTESNCETAHCAPRDVASVAASETEGPRKRRRRHHHNDRQSPSAPLDQENVNILQLAQPSRTARSTHYTPVPVLAGTRIPARPDVVIPGARRLVGLNDARDLNAPIALVTRQNADYWIAAEVYDELDARKGKFVKEKRRQLEACRTL